MTTCISGSLIIIDANTPDVKVFWKGIAVVGVEKLVVHNHGDDSDVKLVVTQNSTALSEMEEAGVIIKRKF